MLIFSTCGSTITREGNTQCDGAYSCDNATMDAHDDIRLLSGYASGDKSMINYSLVAFAHGYWKAAYSDIYSIA